MFSTMTKEARFVIAVLVWIGLFVLSADAGTISVIGTNQKVLVICVKYDDEATTRLANSSDWATLLGSETNQFYSRATFNQTTFAFETPSGGPTDGWFSLGYPSSNYEFFKTGQDAIDLIDPHVDFSKYHRVLVITNWKGFGGQGGGPWGWRVDEGIEYYEEIDGTDVGKRLMTMAIVNEWEANSFGLPFDEGASVAAHELGHQLGLPTHYADLRWYPGISRDVITPWSIMGLSPTLNHFLGYGKVDRGWIPAGPRIRDIGPPVGSDIDQTITLQPLESATTGAQIIRLPFSPLGGGGPFSGYYVENRRQIDGDENLPSQGVLITRIDENPGIVLKCFVMDNPSVPGDVNLAPLQEGQSYNDAARNLTISVLSRSGNNYNVRVRYLLPPTAKPDPMIIPWGAPPYETSDIWIDSEKNGWDTYKYTDASGNPIGNGDDAWVNRDNRVYVRIRNIGPGVATNVRVQVYQNSPPGMGDAGPDWAYLGTIVFPTVASGANVQDWVKWKPKVGEHTCLKAIIQSTPGELSTSNNAAQENVSAFDTSTSSPYKPITMKATVYNPFKDARTPVRFHVRDIPTGWKIKIEPHSMVLPPGGKDSVACTIYPSGPKGVDMPPEMQQMLWRYRPGYIGKPKIEAQVPFADGYIAIGGVEVWTHLTIPTKLTCEIRQPEQRPRGDLNELKEGEARDVRPNPPDKLSLKGLHAIQANRKVQSRKQFKVEQMIDLRPLISKVVSVPTFVEEQPVVVTGSTVPAIAGEPIAVEFLTGDHRDIRIAKTNEDGRYLVRYIPKHSGIWTAQSFFAGNRTQQNAESHSCTFRVVGK